MAKILVVQHERSVRKELKDSLVKAGYDVIDAPNGGTALEIANQDQIDGILLDVNLPMMDGWQVLSKLKEHPQTSKIPVIMLTSYTTIEHEATGMRLGVAHFIAKPWRSETLALTVRVALREAHREVTKDHRTTESAWDNSVSSPGLPSNSQKTINTGGKLIQLEGVLGGGIPRESLTLIEGPSAAGKSVLCQYLIYGAISDGLSLAYFTSEHQADSLSNQMGSIGLDVSGYLQGDKVLFYPLQNPSADDEPESLLSTLASDIERVPANGGVIVVDSITNLAQISRDRYVLGFFASCERLCDQGRTIVVVARSSAFDDNLLPRLHDLCDTHISLGVEKIRDKVVNTLEVRKVGKSEPTGNNRLSFQIEPAVGINLVPISRIRA